jgi:hypothetical protein
MKPVLPWLRYTGVRGNLKGAVLVADGRITEVSAGDASDRTAGHLRGFRPALYILAGFLAAGMAMVVAEGIGQGRAAADATSTCSTSGTTLTVAIATGSNPGNFTGTTSGGAWVVNLNGQPACGTHAYADDFYTTLRVSESPSTNVTTTFSPGDDAGVTFVAPLSAANTNTLDLGATPTGTEVSLGEDNSTVPGTVNFTTPANTSGTDSFEAITEVKGSTSGGTDFQPGSTNAVLFAGQGTSATLDLSYEPTSSGSFTVSMGSNWGFERRDPEQRVRRWDCDQ